MRYKVYCSTELKLNRPLFPLANTCLLSSLLVSVFSSVKEFELKKLWYSFKLKNTDLYPIVPGLYSSIGFHSVPSWAHFIYLKRFPTVIIISQFTNFCLFHDLSYSFPLTLCNPHLEYFSFCLPIPIHLSSIQSYVSRQCVTLFKKSYLSTSAFPISAFLL